MKSQSSDEAVINIKGSYTVIYKGHSMLCTIQTRKKGRLQLLRYSFTCHDLRNEKSNAKNACKVFGSNAFDYFHAAF